MIHSLNKLLTSFNLVQHITFPTHVHGNTLYLIISPKTNKIVTDHSIGPLFSDHFLIFLTLSHPKPTRPLTTRISRKLHSLPIPDFIYDLSSLPTSTSAKLHTSLSSTLDKYAPLFTKTSIICPDSYWYPISLLKQNRILRKADKSYLKYPSPTSLAYYNYLKNLYRKALSTAKASQITHKFDKLSNDSKSIHILSDQLLGRSLKSPLPTITPEELPLLFDNSFNDKLSNTLSTPVIPTNPITFPLSLEKFESPQLDQFISLLKSTSSTSSLDPLPLQILKQIINTVATPLHQIICGSISSRSVPPDFKKAVITPILKKPNLDSLFPSNYRPISNLSIHSKILERVISSQFITYLTTPTSSKAPTFPTNLLNPPITLITSDLLSGLNNNRGTILVLLDISSAFDTIDHNVLIHRLSAICIIGIALNWFTSYIINRSSSVRINTHSFPSRSITHSIPQVSVPLLFNI